MANVEDEVTDWTETVMKDGASFSVNEARTHVTVWNCYGSYTESVDALREKLKSRELLPAVRSMFKAMLDYYEKQAK